MLAATWAYRYLLRKTARLQRSAERLPRRADDFEQSFSRGSSNAIYLPLHGEREREPIICLRHHNQVRRPRIPGVARRRHDACPLLRELYALALRSFKKQLGFTP